ncbi:hypothetical protein DAPPUDRAFT_264195 [Daphnia pulex]|uniref:Uncharacterized protein n=1 Tax=Daphnia pulex TaxID=6669 RepID=E9HR25_DAPPU|nr:hypothetical protein DAPPUDRAFT_264195 [Daphnia pulex]|eukprot:EFX65810.1 hypothetical protein DAPPUDRAFT_264195 [Daphnia pulex]
MANTNKEFPEGSQTGQQPSLDFIMSLSNLFQQVMGPEHTTIALPTHNAFKDVGHIVKFNGENYSDYRCEFLSMMEQLGMKTMVRINNIVTIQVAIDAWLLRDVTCRNYILSTNEQNQKKNLYGLLTAREMWLKIETQYASNAADLENNWKDIDN